MNRIDQCFKDLQAKGEKAFIPYITAGDPTLDVTAQIVMEFEKAGVDIIEFGVPFSDPVGDGVVNQEAAQRALKNNVSLHDVVALVKKFAQGRTVLMVEHNLSVVEDLCDTITVLQRGQVLAEGNYQEVSNDPLVLEAYVGIADD